MEYVAPGVAYSSRLSLGPENTGLVGTVRFRLLDNDATANDPVYGPSIANIIEDPTGSGDYVFHGTTPTTQGKYSPAWDTGAGTPLIYDEDIAVTRTATGPFVPSGNEYVTRDELKEILKLEGESFADLAIDVAIVAASDAINGYKRTRYYTVEETRYYSAEPWERKATIYPLATLTSLTVDAYGLGTYDTVWDEGTDFVLDPVNAAVDGLPYTQIVIPHQSLRRFPSYERSLKVTGAFGWGTTPTLVKQAAILLANRFLTRTRSAPLGILVQAANEVVAMARLGSIDPDVAFSLDQVPDMRRRTTSVQLG